MKNVIISIIIALLLASGLWYFTKAESQNKITLQNTENSTKFSEENLEGQANATSTPINGQAGQVINNKVTTQLKTMNAILHTSLGDITIKLNPESTPKTVENFVKLAQSGFYDGTKFHRVIKDFMNQGGDPLSKDDSQMARWGTGGPGYQFADEITGSNNNGIGSIAMANAGPNTNGSQFFINVADNSFLNTKHTVFGNVTDGMNVVTAINNVQTGANDRPVEAVVIKSISIK
jgi:peptidylprolyl isomerase